MRKLLQRYTPPIDHYQIQQYDHEAQLFRLKMVIHMVDGSQLFVKEYRFQDQSRKYAYQWQNQQGELLIRWDNAPHWQQIATFPHHKHIQNSQNVHPSTETSLENILMHIASQLG